MTVAQLRSVLPETATIIIRDGATQALVCKTINKDIAKGAWDYDARLVKEAKSSLSYVDGRLVFNYIITI